MNEAKRTLDPEAVGESLASYRRVSLLNALTDREASIYLNMSVSFLRQSRIDGIRQNRTPGPTFVKIGRSVRHLKEDLDTWFQQYLKAPKQGGE
jgi:predicted DNA-binding transcriptional regulator AlpA